jgi:hypothetical protein
MKAFCFMISLLVWAVLLLLLIQFAPNTERMLWLAIPYTFYQLYTGVKWVLQ